MRFFLDHCVPTSVAQEFTRAGHEVILQKEAIPGDSADSLVAIASVENDAILVSFDKDFKAIASRFNVSQRRLRKLSRVAFKCTYDQAAKRLKQGAMAFIENEWAIAQQKSDKRMFVEVQGAALRTLR